MEQHPSEMRAGRTCHLQTARPYRAETSVPLSSLLTHRLLPSILKRGFNPCALISKAAGTSACFLRCYQAALLEMKVYFSISLTSKCSLHFSVVPQSMVILHQTPLRCLLRTHILHSTIKSEFLDGWPENLHGNKLPRSA